MTKPKTELTIIDSDDRELVARRLQLWAASTVALAQIDLDLEKKRQEAEKEVKTEKGKQERAVEFHENLIIAIAREHPEWFADKKTLATGLAEVACRNTTSHRAPDEEHSIRLIKKAAEAAPDEVQRARLLGLIRKTETLNLEAIECLGEKELERLKIVRVKSKSYTIKLATPKKAKAGKAKKHTEEPAEAAAA